MKIVDASVFTYCLPFKRPLVLSGGTITERCGSLIRLTADSGAIGWGEAAPLPGFSVESLEDVKRQLTEQSGRLIGVSPVLDSTTLSLGIQHLFESELSAPSTRCAIEMALLDLLAVEAGVTPAKLMSDHSASEVLLNGLIAVDADAPERARGLKRDGFVAVKLKVGRRTSGDDIARVRSVRRELGDEVSLRLDANRAWTFGEAVRVAEELSDCRIEYVEEPLSDVTRLAEFHAKTGLAVALDESLASIDTDDLHEHKYAAAVVLKPTLLGGLKASTAYARAARELGMKVVISSAFESGLGVAALVQLAAAVAQPGVAAGLDTLDRLQQDLLSEPIRTERGRIDVAQAGRASRTVDETRLHRILYE